MPTIDQFATDYNFQAPDTVKRFEGYGQGLLQALAQAEQAQKMKQVLQSQTIQAMIQGASTQPEMALPGLFSNAGNVSDFQNHMGDVRGAIGIQSPAELQATMPPRLGGGAPGPAAPVPSGTVALGTLPAYDLSQRPLTDASGKQTGWQEDITVTAPKVAPSAKSAAPQGPRQMPGRQPIQDPERRFAINTPEEYAIFKEILPHLVSQERAQYTLKSALSGQEQRNEAKKMDSLLKGLEIGQRENNKIRDMEMAAFRLSMKPKPSGDDLKNLQKLVGQRLQLIQNRVMVVTQQLSSGYAGSDPDSPMYQRLQAELDDLQTQEKRAMNELQNLATKTPGALDYKKQPPAPVPEPKGQPKPDQAALDAAVQGNLPPGASIGSWMMQKTPWRSK